MGHKRKIETDPRKIVAVEWPSTSLAERMADCVTLLAVWSVLTDKEAKLIRKRMEKLFAPSR